MISINLNKAKEITHKLRREARAKEFEPFDNAISKQIPGEVNGAEEQRQAIREKYVEIQNTVDAAETVDELKKIVDDLKNK